MKELRRLLAWRLALDVCTMNIKGISLAKSNYGMLKWDVNGTN
jgi:hypothetical protein